MQSEIWVAQWSPEITENEGYCTTNGNSLKMVSNLDANLSNLHKNKTCAFRIGLRSELYPCFLFKVKVSMLSTKVVSYDDMTTQHHVMFSLRNQLLSDDHLSRISSVVSRVDNTKKNQGRRPFKYNIFNIVLTTNHPLLLLFLWFVVDAGPIFTLAGDPSIFDFCTLLKSNGG